jgi:hypothetical protein
MELCTENPDGIQAMIVFKASGPSPIGAMRYHPERELFEHMAAAQLAPNTAPVMGSSFFAADAVERVMVFSEMPKVIAPSRGIHIPT